MPDIAGNDPGSLRTICGRRKDGGDVYMCICHAVTDAEIDGVIGAGATSLGEICAATRAGSSCAMCHDAIEEFVEQRCGSCPLASLGAA